MMNGSVTSIFLTEARDVLSRQASEAMLREASPSRCRIIQSV